jgi:hypothetical protein
MLGPPSSAPRWYSGGAAKDPLRDVLPASWTLREPKREACFRSERVLQTKAGGMNRELRTQAK